MTFQTLRLAAPAKLNLYLHVTGKRGDGYHLLDGLVAFTDIYDELTLAPAPSLSFSADGPFAAGFGDEDPSTNLVVRAAMGIAEVTGREANVALHLRKNLPVASGIGGGSADAAACLHGLAMLWGIDPTDPVILGVAERLGADIPVCLVGRAGFIGGIGTELTLAPELPAAGLLLVNPGIGLSTPAVYRARKGGFRPPDRLIQAPVDARELAQELVKRSNDLTDAAVSLVPEIATVLAALETTEGQLLARMSGSGATCFGLYDSAEGATRAASILKHHHPDWWVAAGRLLSDTSSLTL